jgi:hypothetical protein
MIETHWSHKVASLTDIEPMGKPSMVSFEESTNEISWLLMGLVHMNTLFYELNWVDHVSYPI